MVRYGFIYRDLRCISMRSSATSWIQTYRVICCMKSEDRNSDCKERVTRGCISVVGSFCWITPSRALELSAKA